MKDFHSWISERAGTVVDNSVISDKICTCGVKAPRVQTHTKLTPLQQRAAFADFLMPLVYDENSLCDWVSVFCAMLEGVYGNRSLGECKLADIIGEDKAAEYYHTEGDKESCEWYDRFRAFIRGDI